MTRFEGEPPLGIRYGPEAEQFAQLWLPRGRPPHPVAALVHGGYWRRRYGLDVMHALAADLRERGLAVWNLEYRRVGDPGGGWPGTFADVAAGFDALAEQAGPAALDLGAVSLVGHSAGGHLALWLAARPRLPSGPGLPVRLRPAFVVVLAGVCDVREAARRGLSQGAAVELLGGSPDELPEVYELASPAGRLPLGVPQLVVHGTADDSVPFDIGERYAAAAAAAGDRVEWLPLPGVDHFALIDPASAAWRAVAARLTGRAGGPPH